MHQLKEKYPVFFENIHKYIPDYKTKSLKELINIFNTKYITKIENYHSINTIMEEFNVPHFKTFDFNKRYIVKQHNNLIFIKLLFEDINKWDAILSDIFHRKIKLKSGNVSNKKCYFKIYQKFVKTYKLPYSYLKILENDPEFKIYAGNLNNYINKFKINKDI